MKKKLIGSAALTLMKSSFCKDIDSHLRKRTSQRSPLGLRQKRDEHEEREQEQEQRGGQEARAPSSEPAASPKKGVASELPTFKVPEALQSGKENQNKSRQLRKDRTKWIVKDDKEKEKEEKEKEENGGKAEAAAESSPSPRRNRRRRDPARSQPQQPPAKKAAIATTATTATAKLQKPEGGQQQGTKSAAKPKASPASASSSSSSAATGPGLSAAPGKRTLTDSLRLSTVHGATLLPPV